MIDYSPALKVLDTKDDGIYYGTRAQARIKGATVLYNQWTLNGPYDEALQDEEDAIFFCTWTETIYFVQPR